MALFTEVVFFVKSYSFVNPGDLFTRQVHKQHWQELHYSICTISARYVYRNTRCFSARYLAVKLIGREQLTLLSIRIVCNNTLHTLHNGCNGWYIIRKKIRLQEITIIALQIKMNLSHSREQMNRLFSYGNIYLSSSSRFNSTTFIREYFLENYIF